MTQTAPSIISIESFINRQRQVVPKCSFESDDRPSAILTERFVSADCGKSALEDQRHLELSIAETVLNCGILPNLKGYRFICEALQMLFGDDSLLYGVTKQIYPELARKHGISSSMIEKAIRHSIESAWNRSEESPMRSLFPVCSVRPTNSEFLGVVFQLMSMQLRRLSM